MDARENGITDQGTRATKNNARAEATANMELTDPITDELGIRKTKMTFQWLGVAPSGVSGKVRKSNSSALFSEKWLGVARQWL